jgi:hypothetical protein
LLPLSVLLFSGKRPGADENGDALKASWLGDPSMEAVGESFSVDMIDEMIVVIICDNRSGCKAEAATALDIGRCIVRYSM